MIINYYLVTKPGIIMGNLVTVAGGFALASRGNLNWKLFFGTLIGLAFIIASACVFNNYIDRDSDAKMERTKKRPFAMGNISIRAALTYAVVLGCIGVVVLYLASNLLATLIAFFGFLVYVILYSLCKYHTIYGTLIGSISGAVPPVVGYVAVTNSFDLGAQLLFVILVLWQMPHFYSIAIYRMKEYQAASIPTLPGVKGIDVTKRHMLGYITAFIPTTFLLTFFGYTGYAYLLALAVLGGFWFYLSWKGFSSKNDTHWGQQMFRFSLLTVTILSAMISFDFR